MKYFTFIIISLFLYSKIDASYRIKWQYFKGTIYLNDKDSLKGEILLYPISDKDLLIKTNYLGFLNESDCALHSHNLELVKWLKFKDIKKIEIDLPEQHITIKYEYLPYKKTLWKVLRKSDSTSVYSDLIIPRYGLQYAPKHMILLSHGETLRIYSGFAWFFHNSKTKSLLNNFINRRYNTSFKKTDFKDEDDELDYILNHG